ncbi:MAG: bifunctional methylenetetrahydrofolate dehydrogenase/methenyltetrahydrofolate cyclohydrolase FolD [Syntrophomonas sp.]
MQAKHLDGKAISLQIKTELAGAIEEFRNKGINPGLAMVMVGANTASALYVNMKVKACQELGIYSRVVNLPEDASRQELIETVAKLNLDEAIDGILVQLPLPSHLQDEAILESISPEKDVDCFHPNNQGRLLTGREGLKPCTPLGCIALLKRSGIALEGKKSVIVGRSNIVGKPLALMLLQENATVTICHSRTRNLKEEIKQAELLVMAIGQPEAVGGDDLKPGCIVVDVGQHRLADGRIVGDVDYKSALIKASWITPVPGGTGPMTVAVLMYNTLWAAARRRGLPFAYSLD